MRAPPRHQFQTDEATDRLPSPFSFVVAIAFLVVISEKGLLFLLPFSAQKSHVKPPAPPKSHKTQQARIFYTSISFGVFPVPNAYH
jgi:hypothetical protein